MERAKERGWLVERVRKGEENGVGGQGVRPQVEAWFIGGWGSCEGKESLKGRARPLAEPF